MSYQQRLEEERARLDVLGYSTMPFDLKGNLALIAFVGAGVLAIGTLIVTATWWMAADGTLRTVLENSPLSGTVAQSPGESGSPLLAVGVVGILAIAVLVAISRWRRRLAMRSARGEGSHAVFMAVSLLRTVVLIGGLTLLPVVGGIAAASDLEAGSDPTALASLWQVAIVAIVVTAYTFVSAGRVWEQTKANVAPIDVEVS